MSVLFFERVLLLVQDLDALSQPRAEATILLILDICA